MNGTNMLKGVVAGFVATVVLSALMVTKSLMGFMPELDSVAMLMNMMGASSPVMGWVAHFVIGAIIWGGLFAWLNANIPGGSLWLKGTIFGVGAWLLMMIAVLPMAGASFFGMALGMMAFVMTLVLHIIFGVVFGGVYGAERPEIVRGIKASHR